MAPGIQLEKRKRLDLFEDLFLNIMIGLVVALLIMSRFLPWMVNPVMSGVQEVPKAASEAERHAGTSQSLSRESRHLHFASMWVDQVASPGCPYCKRQTQQAGGEGNVADWVSEDTSALSLAEVSLPHRLLYWLLLAFCVKYLHEASVMRFHLAEWTRRDGPFATGILSEILYFASRISLLACLYAIVIFTFVHHAGWFTDKIYYLALVGLVAYVIPDIVLFRQLTGKEFQTRDFGALWKDKRELLRLGLSWLKSVILHFDLSLLWKRKMTLSDVVKAWLALDTLNLICIVVLFAYSRLAEPVTKWLLSNSWSISLVLLGAVLAAFVAGFVLAKDGRGIARSLGLCGTLVLVLSLPSVLEDSARDAAVWCGVVFLLINLLDWLVWNPRFYFGEFAPAIGAGQAPPRGGEGGESAERGE